MQKSSILGMVAVVMVSAYLKRLSFFLFLESWIKNPQYDVVKRKLSRFWCNLMKKKTYYKISNKKLWFHFTFGWIQKVLAQIILCLKIKTYSLKSTIKMIWIRPYILAFRRHKKRIQIWSIWRVISKLVIQCGTIPSSGLPHFTLHNKSCYISESGKSSYYEKGKTHTTMKQLFWWEMDKNIAKIIWCFCQKRWALSKTFLSFFKIAK